MNRENEHFPVPVCAQQSGLASLVRPSHPAAAYSFSMLRLNLVRTHGIPPDLGDGVHLFA